MMAVNFFKFILNNKKTIGINFLLLILFLLTPSIILKAIEKKRFFSLHRANYISYPNKKLSRKIFSEINQLSSEYKSFIGWRRNVINLKYTNIVGKYNTRYSLGQKLNNSIWFFGGSTVWGYGSPDSGTIPSIFHKQTGKSVFNFGESGWNSRQSLNQLISVIGDGFKPEIVVFIDGVNNIQHQCIVNKGKRINIPRHARENIISNAIQNSTNSYLLLNSLVNAIIKPYKNFYVNNLKKDDSKFFATHDCHINKEKAKKIASHLVNDWYYAYKISLSNDANFYYVLQPNLFTAGSNYDYFNKQDKLYLEIYKKQFEAVYPLVIKEIEEKCTLDKRFCSSFIDGRKWINHDNQVFIDYCHVTEEGNEIITKKLISQIRFLKPIKVN